MSNNNSSIGRYALYKRGTDRLVTFLINAATCCRRSVTAKATKSGKVQTSDLLKWAEILSTWNPPPDIPASIIELINDVILGRTASAVFHVSIHTKPTTKEAKDDAGHQYFIEVLHEVRRLLKQARLRVKAARKQEMKEVECEAPTNSREALANLFELLQVDEPSETSSKAPTKQRAKTASAPPAPVLEVDGAEEKRFALTCFLLDLQEIRALACESWNEYHNGEISLNVASRISETAFGIMRRANNVFTAKYPDLATYDSVLACLGYGTAYNDGPRLIILETGEVMDPQSAAARLLCPVSAFATSKVREHWCDLNALISEEPDKLNTKPPSDPSGVTDCHGFVQTLYQHSTDLWRAYCLRMDRPAASEFERCLRAMQATDSMSISTVSNVQVYLHIHETLETHLDAGCVSIVDQILSVADKIKELEKVMNRVFSTEECSHTDLVNQTIAIFKDLSKGEGAAEVLKSCIESVRESDKAPEMNIWRKFPAAGSHWTENHLATFHSFGAEWAASGFQIISMAHLYNAGRRLGLIESPWPDMEWILREHGNLVLDFGQKRSPGTFESNFAHVTGMPRSLAARENIRLSGCTYNMRPRRALESGSQLWKAEREQKLSDRALGGFERSERQEIVLQKLTEKVEVAKHVGRKPKQAYHSPQYTGIQLLRTFKKLRIEDDMRMNFSYLRFWMICADLVEELTRMYHAHVKATGPDMADYWLVDLLLLDADRQEAKDGQGTELFSCVMELITYFISQEGDKCVTEATELSKGFNPERAKDLPTALGCKSTGEVCDCSVCLIRNSGQNAHEEPLASVTAESTGECGDVGPGVEPMLKPLSKHAATVVDANECDCDQDDCEGCA